MWGSRQVSVRSWRRVVGLGLIGFAAAVVWPLSADPSSFVVVPLGVFAMVYAWWPRILVTDAGVEVRNLHTRRIAWRDVERVITADQVPHLPRGWAVLNRWFGRGGITKVGYLGLCVTCRQGVFPAVALQAVSPWWNLRTTSPRWLVRIEGRLRFALMAARRGASAVDAYRAGEVPRAD